MVAWGDDSVRRLVHTWGRVDSDIDKRISIATITASNRYLESINSFNQLNKIDVMSHDMIMEQLTSVNEASLLVSPEMAPLFGPNTLDHCQLYCIPDNDILSHTLSHYPCARTHTHTHTHTRIPLRSLGQVLAKIFTLVTGKVISLFPSRASVATVIDEAWLGVGGTGTLLVYDVA